MRTLHTYVVRAGRQRLHHHRRHLAHQPVRLAAASSKIGSHSGPLHGVTLYTGAYNASANQDYRHTQRVEPHGAPASARAAALRSRSGLRIWCALSPDPLLGLKTCMMQPVQQPREAAHRAVRIRGLELLNVPVADARLPLVVHRPICEIPSGHSEQSIMAQHTSCAETGSEGYVRGSIWHHRFHSST